MNIASIRRWQLMIVGLVAGALYGYVREASASFNDELASYGARRIGQREFEQALARKLHGRPCLTDLVVTPHRLSGTRARTITLHVVSGLYWDGRTQVEDGKVAARWEPACFVASTPYRPITSPPHGTTAAAEFEDVAAYLRSSWHVDPVAFRYARWWWAVRPQVLWTVVGFVIIGGVWPTVVNLLAFGTFGRPPEAKRISLWNAAAAQQPSGRSADATPDDEKLAALERKLEAALSDTPANASPSAAPRPQVRALRGAEAESAASVAADQKKKDFGADEEDFYPTELRGRHEE